MAGGRGHSSQGGGCSTPALRLQLKRAVGDIRRIRELVREAERVLDSQQSLCQIYESAMRSCGPCPLDVVPEDYGNLCVKRFVALCEVDAEEARHFYLFLAHYQIRQQDSRLHVAWAELRERSGSPQEAIAIVEAALTAGAKPEEPLRQLLARLRRPPGAPEPPLRPRTLSYEGCGFGEPAGDAASPEDATGLLTPCRRRSSGAAPDASGAVGNSEWTRFSVVENLSPILEADSVDGSSALVEQSSTDVADPRPAEVRPVRLAEALPAAPPPVAGGDATGLAPAALPAADMEHSDMSVGTDCSVKPPKIFVVNGVPYRRLKTIGRGGSSKVYQVTAPSGECLALKRVTASCSAHFEALANEVTLLRQLKDCPNVIQVYDAEVSPERHMIHIVMEQGDVDLGRLLQTEPDMSLGQIQVLWRQMLEAVQVIHSERIVHSDLKPGNFLLANGRLKVIDFGIAKRLANETTNISRETSMGTISYMAPEAVLQGTLKMGRPADIWSLGIILYQMIYRRSPFAHLDPMQRLFALSNPDLNVEFPPGHRLESHSEATKAVIFDVLQRCLQRDPRRRPSVPQLLEHPFLQDSIRLTRASFDRTMEALVSGFCSSALTALCGSGDAGATPRGEAEADGGSEGGDIAMNKEQLQLLADEVWERMWRNQGTALPVGEAEGPAAAVFAGLAPFTECLRRWAARGAKRQRLSGTSSVASPASVLSPPAVAVPCSRVDAGKKGAALCTPAALPERRGPSGLPGLPGLQGLPTATAARRPLGPVNRANGPAANRATIHAEMLQLQKSRLRKVPANEAAGKENRPAARDQGNCQHENLVLKRLKERRNFVVDDKADEEMTQVTRWDEAVGGLAGTRAN